MYVEISEFPFQLKGKILVSPKVSDRFPVRAALFIFQTRGNSPGRLIMTWEIRFIYPITNCFFILSQTQRYNSASSWSCEQKLLETLFLSVDFSLEEVLYWKQQERNDLSEFVTDASLIHQVVHWKSDSMNLHHQNYCERIPWKFRLSAKIIDTLFSYIWQKDR